MITNKKLCAHKNWQNRVLQGNDRMPPINHASGLLRAIHG